MIGKSARMPWLACIMAPLLVALGATASVAQNISTFGPGALVGPGQTASETPICGTIGADAHWIVANSPYHVTCNVEVAIGVQVEIDPGVIVRFDRGYHLKVDGSLQAAGTTVQPVTFTSAEANPQPGDWVRVWFGPNHGSSSLQHVIVEYAGLYSSSALHVDHGTLTLRDSTVRHNAAAGVGASVMPTLLDNVFQDNGDAAVRLVWEGGIGEAREIAGNQGWGNGANGIAIRGLVDRDLTLGINEGLPYYTENELRVTSGHTLSIPAGVIFKLSNGVINVDGGLKVEGEIDNPVVFTSLKDDAYGGDTNGDGAGSLPSPGDWYRIFVGQGAWAEVDQAVIQYGGATETAAISGDGASLTIDNSQVLHNLEHGIVTTDGTLVVTGSEISYNGGKGIHVLAASEPGSPTITENTLVGNGGYAICIRSEPPAYVIPTLANNCGSENGLNGIGLDAKVGDTTLSNNPGLPYVIQSLTSVPGVTVVLSAGTVFKADRELAGTGSKIMIDGILQANGEEGNPVVFTSLKDDSYGGDTNGDGTNSVPLPGDWRGLALIAPIQLPPTYGYASFLPFLSRWGIPGRGLALDPGDGGQGPGRYASSAEEEGEWSGSLNHVVVRYGGYDNGNLELTGGKVQITNSTISHSQSRGINAVDAQLEVRNTLVSDNATTGLWLYGPSVPLSPVLVDNDFANNGTHAAYLIFSLDCYPDTEIRGNQAWDNGRVNGIYMEGVVKSPWGCTLDPNPGAPYVIWSMDVHEAGRLIISPGTDLKFVGPTFERATGTMIVTGTLEAVGTADAPISFTSYWDDTIGGDTDGTTEPVAPGDWIGLVFREGSTAVLDHAIVRYGGSTGSNLYATNTDLELENSQIAYGGLGGLVACTTNGTAATTVRNSIFTENGEYAVRVRSQWPTLTRFEFEGNQGSGNGVNAIQLNAALDTLTLKPNHSLPYVIQSVIVAADRTVTVSPGVVVKSSEAHSNGGSLLEVNGLLQVEGVAAEPVYFTSLYDDSVGGDTLGDGAGTTPQPGDWKGIQVYAGGQAALTHAWVMYGGSDSAGIFNEGEAVIEYGHVTKNTIGIGNLPDGTLTVHRSTISNNTGRGITNGGTASVSLTNIYDNGEYGVYSYAAGLVPAEQNYWGSQDGPAWDGQYCFSPPKGSGDLVSCFSVDYEPFVAAPYPYP